MGWPENFWIFEWSEQEETFCWAAAVAYIFQSAETDMVDIALVKALNFPQQIPRQRIQFTNVAISTSSVDAWLMYRKWDGTNTPAYPTETQGEKSPMVMLLQHYLQIQQKFTSVIQPKSKMSAALTHTLEPSNTY